VQKRFEPQAETKGISFQAQLPSGLWIKGNADQLSRLFSNLLENALKYTEAGGNITLSVNQGKGSTVVSVKDTGIGIPHEYLPFVFQRFWRSDQSRAQQQEGSGLGLAICEAIAQQHGGEIEVNSKVGVGTCFRVTLPL
jgi:signal transduction histidine kinase